jgi:hypothetical protein
MFLILAAAPVAVTGQDVQSPQVTLRIIARESLSPIQNVRLMLADGGSLDASMSAGSYLIPRPNAPLMLRVAAVGYQPGEVLVHPDWSGPVTVELDALATTLQDLSATERRHSLRGSDNTWVIDATVAETTPPAVEPDVLRALALAPSVSFSSIRSSRPLIRGVDADDTGFSIDGHEVVNLYHIGRSFAGFPQIAARSVTVGSQPSRVDVGRTTSGRVEIEGLTWDHGQRSEFQYGLGAWSAVTGWSNDAVSATVAGRTITGSPVGAALSSGISDVQVYDVYGRLELDLPVPVSITAFRSIDRGVDPEPQRGEMVTLDWETTLLGLRAGLLRSPLFDLDVSGSFSTRAERGQSVPARRTIVDLDNENERIGGKIDGTLKLLDNGPVIRLGGDFASRHLRNVIWPREEGRFVARDYDHTATETAAWLDLELPILGGMLRSGMRVDGYDELTAVQPRLSFIRPLGDGIWTTVAAGRAARLVHQISDARAEPKVSYYDIWVPADGVDVPVAIADHLTAELGWSDSQRRLRLGVFHSEAEGQLDLAGGTFASRNVDGWRAGRSRVIGAEVEASAFSSDRRWSAQLSYVAARSERDWGEGWVPWINDRTHQLRISGQARPLQRTIVSPSLEVSSGQPYTPFVRVEQVGRSYQSVFGTENSARGKTGVRFGAAIQQELRGPMDTELTVGFSVTNLGFGDQAPREASVNFVPATDGGPINGALPSSRQVSELPVIPSLLVNVKF